ncbi:MAG: NAD-dependent epimerase/dehydratase family protein [Firmicutes bacterium]|nr:NAD-dependent epimerase/dehydratase family protein [Bacillota bacterium]
MKILVTGAAGFVGQNLIAQLENIRDGREKTSPLTSPEELEILACSRRTSKAEFEEYCRKADFVVHLAGVNRTPDDSQFMAGNAGFTDQLLSHLEKNNSKAPVLYASSIHASSDTLYGRSKKAGEALIREYGRRTGAPVYIYRLTNLFGKWCRPNYNSVVATFCHNIARDLNITVNDPEVVLTLTYIDDVVDEIIRAAAGQPTQAGGSAEGEELYCVPVTYQVKLGRIAQLLCQFRYMRDTLQVPKLDDPFEKKLYSTYLSHLPEEAFSYRLKPNTDQRGSFTEIIRTPDRGQVSVNISKPGITKGNHWHHTKNEKFLVVSGHGLIQLRKLGTDAAGNPHRIVEFEVRGEDMEVVEMIPGYTHNIINLSETEDLVTLMWANEAFDPARPDTYFEPV